MCSAVWSRRWPGLLKLSPREAGKGRRFGMEDFGHVFSMKSKVRVKDLDSGKRAVYSLIFPRDANISDNEVNSGSIWPHPLRLSSRRCDRMEVPAGTRRIRIEGLSYQALAAVSCRSEGCIGKDSRAGRGHARRSTENQECLFVGVNPGSCDHSVRRYCIVAPDSSVAGSNGIAG